MQADVPKFQWRATLLSGKGLFAPDHTPERSTASGVNEVRGASDERASVHDGSGNVFADMGTADADERQAKAETARFVRTAIREKGLTQQQAAELLGLRQPAVSDLVRGKPGRFSRTRLERMLNALDMEIRIQVGPRPSGKDHAGITVEHVASF